MTNILLSDLAVQQLGALSPAHGRVVLAVLQRLREFPLSAPSLAMAGYETYRQLIVQQQRVVYGYFPDENLVRIYCVLHVRRQLPPAEFLTHQVF